MIRRRRRLLAALLATTLVGCAPESGVVTSTRWSYVCVRDAGGESGCHKVRHDLAVRCHVGDRWPDCIT